MLENLLNESFCHYSWSISRSTLHVIAATKLRQATKYLLRPALLKYILLVLSYIEGLFLWIVKMYS